MADAVTRPDRRWAARMVIAVVGCLMALAWLWSGRAGYPSDGTVIALEAPVGEARAVVVRIAAGPTNPLRPGDVVTTVNGQPLAVGTLGGETLRVGDVLVYGVVRAGEELAVPVPLVPYPFGEFLAYHWLAWPYLVLLVLLPSFVVARRPRDPAAVTIYLVTVLQIVGYAADWYGPQAVDIATGRLWVTVVAQVANCLVWACLLHFATSFPQPWPVLRRRPGLIAVAYGLPFVAYGIWLATELPGSTGLDRTSHVVAMPWAAARLYPVLTVAALLVSYALTRDPFERRRIRLVSIGLAALTAAYLLLGPAPEMLTGRPLVDYQYIALLAVPAQLLAATAVLRHRLWDIQVILRRSLVYGLVTLALLATYLGVAALVSRLLNASLSPAVVVLALVVALSFAAAQSGLRRVVSRLVFGEREDPYEVLRQLGRRLESASSAETVLNQLVATLVRTLRLSHAAIEVPGLSLPSASHGSAGITATSIDLVHEGERIGRLVLDPGPDREPFGPSDRRLLEGLAQQVSTTVHSLLLAARLRRSLEERVTALEDERRRLRREIHDSLGPTIASASIRLDVGRLLMRSDPDEAERVFADLAQVNRSLVDDIRRLIDGLRPTVLDSLGLEAALRELTARLGGTVRTTLDCAVGSTPLPAAVEVAAYRIVSEALTNVVRHAGARTCDIRVWRDGELHIEVSDDGRGLPADCRPGMGLTSIRERCAELGGQVEVGANAPRGTVLRCRLPVGVTVAPPAQPGPRPSAQPGPRSATDALPC
jgi:two-component system NarL family sensor kinase